MKVPYTKSGKCGGTVWQRNRYGQISYPAFVPFNPRSPAQIAVRDNFRAVSARWRTLTQAQRDVWIAVAQTKWSKPRLRQRGRLPGFNLFVKVNVALANRGEAQVDLPPGYPQPSKLAVSSRPVACEGRRQHEEGRKMPPKVLPGLVEGVCASKRDTGTGVTSLRYRSCTGVSPEYHRSTTLAGRWTLRRPQSRLRFPCRLGTPRCRGAMRGVCRAPPCADK
jgi:hypothetical protein